MITLEALYNIMRTSIEVMVMELGIKRMDVALMNMILSFMHL